MNNNTGQTQFILVTGYILVIFSVLCLMNFSAESSAQTSRTIALKDGSLLKGKIIQLHNGIYTLETSFLGRIEVPEAYIVSITSGQAAQNKNWDVFSSSKDSILKGPIHEPQSSLFSDPKLMAEILDLLNDEDVQTMLADPKLLDGLLTYDPEKIRANENIQNILQNPNIQNLINMILLKIPAEK